MGNTCVCEEAEPSADGKTPRDINVDRKQDLYSDAESDIEVPSRSVSSARDEIPDKPLPSVTPPDDTPATVEEEEPPEPKSEPEPQSEPEPKSQPELEPEPEAEPEPKTEPKPEAEPAVNPDPDPNSESVAQPELEAESQPEPEPQPEPETQPEPELQQEAVSQPKPELKLELQPEPVLDPTLGGVLNWHKLADFAAMLPTKYKEKLWKGVLKGKQDQDEFEPIQIKKVMKYYKKTGRQQPSIIKSHLPEALEYPSKFMFEFLTQDPRVLISNYSTIHDMLVMRCENSGQEASDNARYIKETNRIRDNWLELESEPLRGGFNAADFIRPAFLQYLIYAFCYEACDWFVAIPLEHPALRNFSELKGSDPLLVNGFLRENLNALLPADVSAVSVSIPMNSLDPSIPSIPPNVESEPSNSSKVDVLIANTSTVQTSEPSSGEPVPQNVTTDATEQTSNPNPQSDPDPDAVDTTMDDVHPSNESESQAPSTILIDEMLSQFSLLTIYYYHHLYPVTQKPEFVAPDLEHEIPDVPRVMSPTVSKLVLAVTTGTPSEHDTEHEEEPSAATTYSITPYPYSSADEGSDDEEVENEGKLELDVTMGGLLNWHAMADFVAMLPPSTKEKVWKRVFKTDADLEVAEEKRMARLLRPLALLYLKGVEYSSFVYRQRNEKMPRNMKARLRNVVVPLADFMTKWLKINWTELSCNISVIYDILMARLQRSARSPRASFRGEHTPQIKTVKSNYEELISQPLHKELNKEDFIRPAFMQYLICAYCYEIQHWTAAIELEISEMYLSALETSEPILVDGFMRECMDTMDDSRETADIALIILHYHHHIYVPGGIAAEIINVESQAMEEEKAAERKAEEEEEEKREEEPIENETAGKEEASTEKQTEDSSKENANVNVTAEIKTED